MSIELNNMEFDGYEFLDSDSDPILFPLPLLLLSWATRNFRFESGKFPPLATKFPKIPVVEKRSK